MNKKKIRNKFQNSKIHSKIPKFIKYCSHELNQIETIKKNE